MKWTLEDSRLVYGVGREDLHFLDIDKNGNLCIRLNNHQTTMKEVIQRIGRQGRERGYTKVPSFNLCIPQLIDSQIHKVREIFQNVMTEQEYQGGYRVLYPIKVNPKKSVIQHILERNPDYGLEVGTKWELFIVLEELKHQKERLIMCNGVKDIEYIEIIHKALKENYNIWVSVESVNEAKIILDRLPQNIMSLALRIKPYVSVISHWDASAGRHSKFGLNIMELFKTVKLLQQKNAEAAVVAIHAHPGSQVLDNIYAFAEYLAKTYTFLHDSGFSNLRVIDVGGGLPINYDGHLTPGSIHSDATAIIVALTKILGQNYPQPDIINESGRIIMALYTLLIVRTIELRRIFPDTTKKPAISLLTEAKKAKDARTILQAWKYWINQASNHNGLPQVCEFEQLTGYVKTQLRQLFVNIDNYKDYITTPIAKDLLRPEYIIQGSFSVFNGACDHVMVGQYFPVLPITNLHSQPTTLVRLVDLTRDSDGEISNYTPPLDDKPLFTQDGFPLTSTQKLCLEGFPIGDLSSMEDNFLAIALVGAYQNVIEMAHHLVGELPNIQLSVSSRGEWQIEWLDSPQTIQDLATQLGFTNLTLDDSNIG